MAATGGGSLGGWSQLIVGHQWPREMTIATSCLRSHSAGLRFLPLRRRCLIPHPRVVRR
jgi:hypothetical protein